MIYEKRWIDSKTKLKALKKLGDMTQNIGASDEIYLIEKLDSYYEQLDIEESDSITEMESKITMFNYRDTESLSNPRASEINAYNSIESNSISTFFNFLVLTFLLI